MVVDGATVLKEHSTDPFLMSFNAFLQEVNEYNFVRKGLNRT